MTGSNFLGGIRVYLRDTLQKIRLEGNREIFILEGFSEVDGI